MSAGDVNCFFKTQIHTNLFFHGDYSTKFAQTATLRRSTNRVKVRNWKLTPTNHTTVNPKQWLDSKCF